MQKGGRQGSCKFVRDVRQSVDIFWNNTLFSNGHFLYACFDEYNDIFLMSKRCTNFVNILLS